MPTDVVHERKLKVVSDRGSLEPLCAEILARNPAQSQQYRAGKTGVLGYLVGQVMKSTAGAADPKLVNQILVKLLEQN